MIETPQSELQQAAEPESLKEYFGRVFRWTAEFTRGKQYFKTRKAVIEGEELYARSAADLKRADRMSPLTFNVYETTLAALPTQLMVAAAWFVGTTLNNSDTVIAPPPS